MSSVFNFYVLYFYPWTFQWESIHCRRLDPPWVILFLQLGELPWLFLIGQVWWAAVQSREPHFEEKSHHLWQVPCVDWSLLISFGACWHDWIWTYMSPVWKLKVIIFPIFFWHFLCLLFWHTNSYTGTFVVTSFWGSFIIFLCFFLFFRLRNCVCVCVIDLKLTDFHY